MRLPAQNAFDSDPYSSDQLKRKYFQKILRFQRLSRDRDRNYMFGVFDPVSGDFIGNCNLFVMVRWHLQYAMLGYGILNCFWGRGYGKETARLAVDLGFRTLKLHRIEAPIEPANSRSIAVAKSLKMRKEGRLLRYYFNGKAWVTTDLYSITSEEWGLRGSIPKIRITREENL